MSKPDGMSHGMSDFSFFPTTRQQQSPPMAMPSGFLSNGGKIVHMPDANSFRDQQQRGIGHQQSTNSRLYQGLGTYSVPEEVHVPPLQSMKIPQDPRLVHRNCVSSYVQYSGTPRPHQTSQMGVNMQSPMQSSPTQNFIGRSLGEGQASRMLTPVHHNDVNPLQYNQYHTPVMGNQSAHLPNTISHSAMTTSSGAWAAQQNIQYPGKSIPGRKGMTLPHTPIGTSEVNPNSAEHQAGNIIGLTAALASPCAQNQSYDHPEAPGLKRRSTQPSTSKTSKKRRGLSSQFMTAPALPDSQQVQNEKVKAIYEDMQCRVGPIFTTQARMSSDTVRRTCMSLLSGVPAAVNMALNSLSLLSFHGLPLLMGDQTKLIAALCRVIDRSLAKRPPPMLIEAHKSPQLEKRFWWEEEEEGLIANFDQPAETFMWGICASNILRNMVISSQQGHVGNFSMVVPRVLKCLVKRDGSSMFNEMALNMLETIQGMEGKADPLGENFDCTLLVEVLVKHMRDNRAPLRLRTASAGAFASIAGTVNHKEQVLKLGASEDLSLGGALSSLMRCSSKLSRKSAEEEANGEMGYVDLVLPEPLKDHEIELLSWRLQSEAISAATKEFLVLLQQVCEFLCQLEIPGPARIAAAHSSILRFLLKVASCKGFSNSPIERGGLQHSQHPFAICARNALKRAERSAMSILSHVATSREQCICLLPFKYEIIEGAFSNTAYAPQMLRLLMMIEEVCSTENNPKGS